MSVEDRGSKQALWTSSFGAPALLIVIGLSLVTSFIARVRSETGETPFLSANDRSRWAAMAALVHEGTSVTDRPQAFRDKKTKRRTLQSIDRVMHVGADGEFHSYSSKPPLLVILYAAAYTLVHVITGASVYDQPMLVGRWTLVVAHLLPLALYWSVLLRLIQHFTQDGWTRWYLAAAAILGTHVTSFSATVNNHGPGAWAALFALASALHVLNTTRPQRWAFLAGISAAMGVVCELPALAWAAALGAFLLWQRPRVALVGYGSGALVVALAFFASNFWAHGSWRPPYMHRGVGPEVASFENHEFDNDEVELNAATRSNAIAPAPDQVSGLAAWMHDQYGAHAAWMIVPALRSDHWEVRVTHDAAHQRIGVRWALVPTTSEPDKEITAWSLRQWDDWYDYPGSYWAKGAAKGVDRGEASRATYAFHALLGHHGLLLLTPIWFFTLVGGVLWLRRDDVASRGIALAIASTTLACLLFYLSRPVYDRNYGGVSCCFRWLVWFAPLWIWLSIPCVEMLAKRNWGRLVALLALAIAVFSMIDGLVAPWQHPWLYRYWTSIGWIVAHLG